MMARLPLLVFDVNETLLDLESLTPFFSRRFGDKNVMRTWFAQLVLYSQSLSLTGGYIPFGILGAEVLKMVAATLRVNINKEDFAELKYLIENMPALPEVAGALTQLQNAGFRLFTLTNNPQATLTTQLTHAELTGFFERHFSVDDSVKCYKPAPSVYQYVATELQVSANALCLVACHTWDIIGARSAGWDAAMILHSGNAQLGAGGQPHVIGNNVSDIADKLIARYVTV
ncbi:haloacid dehalogenase type II [Acerihabitans sp. TG2]|uniref:haloacid dehalogenase type II n=1 Tax=Acerihabitans sp. TG2 TaxID=3096008 RepID=UPI002B22430D|nr:haloacid dehalogenase type II [Acerihabitans sp. TG2]MEA9393114.1 haloacid dehalogenase type II [Acerihabitans sp. TG2]